MKLNEEKKVYVEPQIVMFALAGDCPILAGSPPVETTPTVVAPDVDDDDTKLIPENLTIFASAMLDANQQQHSHLHVLVD